VSHIFQRPLCEMGGAYDFAFRPVLGDPGDAYGGPCDDRPHRVELWGAAADPQDPGAAWRGFALCPDHELQLREFDGRFRREGRPSRFRGPAPRGPTHGP